MGRSTVGETLRVDVVRLGCVVTPVATGVGSVRRFHVRIAFQLVLIYCFQSVLPAKMKIWQILSLKVGCTRLSQKQNAEDFHSHPILPWQCSGTDCWLGLVS